MTKSKPRSLVEDYQRAIGDRIRRLRRDRQMTQLELAHRVGVTNGQISTIERGLSAPSIGTLRRISEALSVPLREFFDRGRPRRVLVVRSYERQRLMNPLGSEVVHLLAGSDGMSAVQVALDPDQACTRNRARENAHHFIFIVNGRVELTLGSQQHLVRAGDSFQMAGRLSFAIRNVGDEPASLLEVRTNGAGA